MNRLTYIFLLLILIANFCVFLGCDQGKKMAALVMGTDDPTSEAKDPPPVLAEEVIPEITFENVLDLEVGKKYRIKPSSYTESYARNWFDHTIPNLFFSSVREGIPADTLAVEARFTLNPAPYLLTPDHVHVITRSPVYDEIIIEIKQKTEQGEARGGLFTIVTYEAVAIENLTNPDLKFEYE